MTSTSLHALSGLKSRIAVHGPLLNGYCMMPGGFSAEVFASQGFDCISIDMQHGLIGIQDAVTMLQATSHLDIVPLVRVPTLDPGIIMRVLDAGALGVTCPMIETVEQASQLIQYSYYPPLGQRSYGPLRALLRHGEDYLAQTRDAVSTFAMIETAKGVENVDEITAVNGLTGVYIGTVDLAMSLGLEGARPFENEVLDAAIQKILDATLKRGLIAGLLASDAEMALRFTQMGFNFITIATDVSALRAHAGLVVRACRKGLSRSVDEAPTRRGGY